MMFYDILHGDAVLCLVSIVFFIKYFVSSFAITLSRIQRWYHCYDDRDKSSRESNNEDSLEKWQWLKVW
jgi:hypothetical protein